MATRGAVSSMNSKSISFGKSLEASNIGNNYKHLLSGISSLLEESRKASARSVNAILTATYWEIGRRIVEFEQRRFNKALWERIFQEESVSDKVVLFDVS